MRMTREQALLVAGFLGATAAVVSGLDHWGDLVRPNVIGGFAAQIAVMLRALYVQPYEQE
jgi:hypothetical protein